MLCSMLKALWGMTVFDCWSKKSKTGLRCKNPSSAKRKIMNGNSKLVHLGGSRPPVTLSSLANETTIHGRRGGAIMPGPQPPPIILTERQRKMLAHLARRATSTQRLARRARIVLAAAEGANNEQIAQRLGINRETSRLWRGVWLENEERLGIAEEAGEK